MIIIDLIYLAIYSFFRRFFNKFSFDVPGTRALYFLAFFVGVSSEAIYYTKYFGTSQYSKITSWYILLISFLLTLLLHFRYKDKKHEKYYLKYKSYLLVPSLLVLIWMYFVFKYIIIIYFS